MLFPLSWPSSPLTTCFSFSTVLQLCLSHKKSSWLALVAQGGAGYVCNIYERKYDIKLGPNIECTFTWYWNNFACEHSGITLGQSWCQRLGQGAAQHSSSTCWQPKLCFHTESNSGTHEAKDFDCLFISSVVLIGVQLWGCVRHKKPASSCCHNWAKCALRDIARESPSPCSKPAGGLMVLLKGSDVIFTKKKIDF